jgi:hypothetical protein
MIRRVALVGLLAALVACGVAISGRVDIGEHAGEPVAARPCPGE